ncbi:MAG TPA: GNAT family N-acetyltransferase [Ktedonobacterales bacterium]|jgi:GNAT superfamily N-acetyltransferase
MPPSGITRDQAQEEEPFAPIWPDGETIFIRKAQPEDEAGLKRMFYRLSPRTLYQRFFSPIPLVPLQAQRVAALASVDPARGFAVVACGRQEIRGVARYDREQDPRDAELSVLIEDAWQGRGLGKMMLAHVIVEARRQGITRFIVNVLGDNRPALRVVQALFANAEWEWDGEAWQGYLPVKSFQPLAPPAESGSIPLDPGRRSKTEIH